MKRYRVEDIMKLRPCYCRLRVAKLYGKRKALSLAEILRREDVPASDRVWVAIGLMPLADAVKFARRCPDKAYSCSITERVKEATSLRAKGLTRLAPCVESQIVKNCRCVAERSFFFAIYRDRELKRQIRHLLRIVEATP